MPEWAIALLSLVSGLVGGVFLAEFRQWRSDRSERRRMRRDVLRRLVGYRYHLTPQFTGCDSDFWAALNEVVVAYLDDADVIRELHAFRRLIEKRCFKSPDLLPLLWSMAKAAELPEERLDSGLIENPLVPPLSALDRTTDGDKSLPES